MPEYRGRIAYVDAVTTDPRSTPVLDRYAAQYIPTSIFVTAEGEVAETFVGPMSAEELRRRLDSLGAE